MVLGLPTWAVVTGLDPAHCSSYRNRSSHFMPLPDQRSRAISWVPRVSARHNGYRGKSEICAQKTGVKGAEPG